MESSGAPGKIVWPSTTTPDFEVGVKVNPARVKVEEMPEERTVVKPSIDGRSNPMMSLSDGESDMVVPDLVIGFPPAISVVPAIAIVEGLMMVINWPATETVAEVVAGREKV